MWGLRKRVVAVTFFLLLVSPFYSQENMNMRSSVEKNKPIVAFDAHGVLLNFDYPKLFALVGAGAILTGLVAAVFGWKPAAVLAGIPLIGWGAFGLWYFWHKLQYGYSPCVEAYLQGDAFYKKALLRTWLLFANLFTPNKQMFDLAWKLKDQGCEVFLASNIGKIALAELQQKYSGFFTHGDKKLFDVVFQPGCGWSLAPEDAERFNGGWLVKTNKNYFLGLFDFVKKHVASEFSNLVFIDDNRRFIERAKEFKAQGVTPVFFTHFDRLCEQLGSFGLKL